MKKFLYSILFLSLGSCSLFGLSPVMVMVHKPIYKIVPALAEIVPINKQERTNIRVFFSEYFRIVKKEGKIRFVKIYSYSAKPVNRYKIKFNISGDSSPYTLFITVIKEKQFIRNAKRTYESVEVSKQVEKVVKKELTTHLGKRSKSFNMIDDFRVF